MWLSFRRRLALQLFGRTYVAGIQSASCHMLAMPTRVVVSPLRKRWNCLYPSLLDVYAQIDEFFLGQMRFGDKNNPRLRGRSG